MGKLTAIKTKSIFQSLLNSSSINEHNIHFILDTGQIYTHGIYINGAAYGTEVNGTINLSIAGVTKTLALSTHTHSTYLEKDSNIDIGSYIIKSGDNELLKWSSNKLILGSPTYITGTAHTTRNSTNYDVLDTGNFSVEAKTSTNIPLQNVATIKYGGSTFQIDYVRRINGVYTFDNITYTSVGTTSVNNQQYGIITMYTDGTTPASYAQIRADIPNGKLEYRTSGSTAWKTIVTGALPTVFVGSGSNHASGLVPDPGATAGTTKFLCEDGTWRTPSYTSDTNTWRKILVNGTQKLGDSITTGSLDIINGTNTTVEWTSANKLKINATDTWNANALGVAGYVAAPTREANANMTWQTDADGNPAWRASNNHSHSYLPLSGGTITGIITRDAGGSWIYGRDNAIIKTTRTSSEGGDWHPAVAVKTSIGCWTFGSVGGEHLGFSYDTDSDYNVGNNTSTVISLPTAGSSGTLALTSQIPTNNNQLTNGAGYITLSNVKGNFSSWDNSPMSWGTLTTANGYTIGVHASSEDGGDWGMTYKGGQISMQLDGFFYQNEGQYRVLDTSDIGVNIASQSALSSYLPLSGGTMTGDLKIGGSYNLYHSGVWDNGVIAGADGHDKVVLTYLASSTNGAVIGAHNSALGNWAPLNISGTTLIFRSSETEKMRMDSSGNLGIGTDSPGYKLDVNGTARVRDSLIVSSNNSTGGGIILADDGDIVDLNDAYCTMRFSYGVRITNANRGGSTVHELNANGKLYNYGLYHLSYGSSDYFLTSDGGAKHWSWLDNYYLRLFRRINSSGASTNSGTIPPSLLEFKSGYPLHTDPEFASGYNDINIYDNNGSGNTYLTREISSNCGNSSGYVIKVTSGSGASPGYGGWYFGDQCTVNTDMTCIFRALIPEGVSVEWASNSIGSGGTGYWLTNNVGTGRYEWYAYHVKCGTGSEANTFFFYVTTPCTWYLSFANTYRNTWANYDGLRTRYSDYANSTGNADTVDGLHASDFIRNLGGDGGSISGFYNTAASNRDFYWGFNGGGSNTYAVHWTNLQAGYASNADTVDGYHYNNLPYLPISGGTLTGNLSFSNSGTEFRGINYGTMGDNDQWRIGGAATASNSGYMEIATADDGTEPIYVRQYTGVFSSLTRTLTLLDASGNTSLPGDLSCGSITTSGVTASGTSNRLTFRHLDGQNCGGDYGLYLQYHTGATIYLGGSSYYITNSGSYYNGTSAYANSCAWGNVTDKPFTGTTFNSGDNSNHTHDCNEAWQNGHYYYYSNGPSGLGESTGDGALYVQNYSSSWVGQIAQDYRNGRLFMRGKNNGSWTSWMVNLDSQNYSSYTDGRYLRYEGWWNDGSGQNVNDSCGMNFTYTSHGAPHHWGTTVTFECDRGSSYRLQLHGTGDNYLYFRNRSADYGGWHSSGWKQILTNQDTYVASDGTNRGIINGTEVASARHLLINGVTWNSDWHWSGQSGQPSWLWGSNDGVNMYVWNPSNFSVSYASRAAYLDGHGTNPDNSHPGYGARVFYSWNIGQAGNSSAGYSNGITIGSHPSDQAYGFQIVQNMWDDRTYTRRYNGGWQEWKTLAWTSDLNGYLALSGGTMTGVLSLASNRYSKESDYALNLNNSDIVGVNSICTADLSDEWGEGFQFKRSNGNWDSFRAADGTFYFAANSGSEKDTAAICSASTNLNVVYSNRLHGGNNNNLWLQSANNVYITPSSASIDGNNCIIFGTNYMHIKGTTNATMTSSSSNPRILFSENGDQPVFLTYTDYDAYRNPAGLKVVGGTDATPAWFEAEGNMYATNFYTTSDRNKKKNITILSEHIRKFTLKDNNKDMYGVIAQEVPEMFREGEEGNMTVNYSSVLSYYIGLLENKVELLGKELNELKQKYNNYDRTFK